MASFLAKNRAIYVAVLWACLAQFMFLFALDNPHSVNIHKISIKLNGLHVANFFYDK